MTSNNKAAPAPRVDLLDIPIYMRGLARVDGAKQVIKLSSNENPLGCSASAIRAFADAAGELHRYPEVDDEFFRQAIAECFSVNPSLIYCGAGSDQILNMIVNAYAGKGDAVIYSENGFMKFRNYAMMAGATPVAVPDNEFRADVDDILAAISDRTRLIMLANPDNPSGTWLPKSEILRLHAGMPSNVLLILDAAYAEYANAADYSACMHLVESSDNVIVSRTFSKIFGLASARLGWVYAPEAVVDVLRRTEGSFPIVGPSYAAGLAALEDRAFVEKSLTHNTRCRIWLSEQLSGFDLQFNRSQTNFLLLEFSESARTAKSAYQYLLSKGIIGRMFARPALNNCLRVSIGLDEELQVFVSELARFFGE